MYANMTEEIANMNSKIFKTDISWLQYFIMSFGYNFFFKCSENLISHLIKKQKNNKMTWLKKKLLTRFHNTYIHIIVIIIQDWSKI